MGFLKKSQPIPVPSQSKGLSLSSSFLDEQKGSFIISLLFVKGRGWAFIPIFFLLSLNSFSQTLKDTIKLKEINVIDKRIINQSAYKTQRIDSITLVRKLNTNLSGLLSEHSLVFMKTYGAGSLASPSLRGTSANHTQVLWNGVDLNSPMNGQFDFALIPVSSIENIIINYGATSLLNKSGSFGGNILLQSEPEWNNQMNLSFQQTIASFSNFNTCYNLKFGDEKFQSSTKIVYISGKNDFTFRNIYIPALPIQKLTNAELEQNGVIQEFFWKVNQKNILSAKVWYSQSDRNIPPIITSSNTENTEKQIDNTFRSILEWEYFLNNNSNSNFLKLTTRTAYTYDYNNYYNELMNLDAEHYVNSSKNQFLLDYKKGNSINIESGINFDYTEVKSDNYKGLKNRNVTGLYSYFDFKVFPFLNLFLITREEYIDSAFTPFLPSIGLKIRPCKKSDFYIKTNYAKNFRYPTFNDLYWQPGGNPALTPEKNHSIELGILYEVKHDKLAIETEFTTYYSRIYNMIVWTPTNFGYWSAQNLKEVLNKGIELFLNVKYHLKDFNFSLENNYNYCSSTNHPTNSVTETDLSAGKQLIYTPLHIFNSTLNIERKTVYFSINQNYIGKRYITSDNETWMPAYGLTNFNIGKTINFNSCFVSLQFQVNNFFNKQYQSIAYRPMPGRNYAVAVKFEMKK